LNSPERGHSPERDSESSRRNAFALILARLGRRDHTEHELVSALAGKGIPEDAIEHAVARARREGLIDDERFARAMARNTARSGKRGPRRVVATLRQKGIAPGAAQAAAREAFAASEEVEAGLGRLALRLFERARDSTLKGKRARVLRSLQGRGFELSEAKKALQLAENTLMIENRVDEPAE
jgi:SOS response regulatory protein OraA/RecX